MPTTKQNANKFGLPYLGLGLGLRAKHYDHIINHKPKIDWFEVISENYMNRSGRVREKLDEIRNHYPVVMHGVSMNIGSSDALDKKYLQNLKELAAEIKPVWISDHLCWTGINGKNTHDLLPVPLNAETLTHITSRVKQVQDFLGRPLLLENPSSYLTFRADNIPEHEFLAELSEKADCALLLDVNNIYVASYNQRLDPLEYINALPQNRIVQIHLAGHTNMGTHIIDTHDTYVNDDVWNLYTHATGRFGNISTMIEWDGNIPEFPVLEAELQKTQEKRAILSSQKFTARTVSSTSNRNLASLQNIMQTAIHEADTTSAATWIDEKENFPPHKQLQVYINAYRLRLAHSLLEDYPQTAEFLGEDIKPLVKDYIEDVHSIFPDLAHYSWGFADSITTPEAAYIADIERKSARCFDLPDTTPASAQDFSNIPPHEFLELHLTTRGASFLVKGISRTHGHLALYREGDEIFKFPLEENEFQLLQNLNSGKNIGTALEDMPDNITPEDIQKYFARWLENKLISITN